VIQFLIGKVNSLFDVSKSNLKVNQLRK